MFKTIIHNNVMIFSDYTLPVRNFVNSAMKNVLMAVQDPIRKTVSDVNTYEMDLFV